MKKVDYRFKFLYVIGTLAIVIGHTGETINLFSNFIPYASYFLAIFAFSSGYFFSDKKCEQETGIYIWHKVKSLLIPFYIYNIAYGLFVAFTRLFGFSIGADLSFQKLFIECLVYPNNFVYNLASWYVIPLLLTQIFYILLRKVFKKLKYGNGEYLLFLIELLLGVFGVIMAQNGYNRWGYLLITRTLYLIPFFGLGILYKRKLEAKDNLSNGWYFSILLALKLLIITFYGRILFYSVVWCNDFNETPIMPFIVGTIGIAFWLRIARILNPILPESKMVKAISDCSYSIMMNQVIGFMFVKTVYAVIARYTPLFNDFNMAEYKSNVWYYYFPGGMYQWGIVYVAAGIVIPILMQKVIDIIAAKIKTVFYKQN